MVNKNRFKNVRTASYWLYDRPLWAGSLSIVFVLLVGILGGWLYHNLTYPSPHLFFTESFDSQMDSWKILDGNLTVQENEEGIKNGTIQLCRKEYATPYLMKKIAVDQSPLENFVWHFRVKVHSFTNEAVTLGTLFFPTGQVTIVVNKEGNLGVAYNLFEKPIYNTNPLERLTNDKWQDLYIHVDDVSKQIEVYKGEIKVLSTKYESETYPVQEVWLGTIWLNGGGNYGAPLDIAYDEVSLGNLGLLPKPSLIEYMVNSYKKIWDKISD